MNSDDERARERMESVRVGEDSRTTARMPIHQQVECLQKELSSLNSERLLVEAELSDISEWKRSQLAVVYGKRYPKSESCARTNSIESEFLSRRSGVLKKLHAINERRHQVKSRLSNKAGSGPKDSDHVVNVRKILAVLNRIAAKLGA